MGQITSANDGTNVPSDDGFEADGDFIGHVINGTTISAVWQVRSPEGNWVDIPDPDGLEVVDGDWMRPIAASPGDRFRIAVTTATGTWDWGYRPRNRR